MSTQIDIEQLDLFDLFKDYVDSSIHNLINSLFSNDSKEKVAYSDLYYYPIFTLDFFGKKTLKRLMIKNSIVSEEYIQVCIEDIDSCGASWEEVLLFLQNSPANRVNGRKIY